jgi:FtsP/CotA-like multicopper oxidase with cupredoxin domain
VTPADSYQLPSDLAAVYTDAESTVLMLNRFYFSTSAPAPGADPSYSAVANSYGVNQTITPNASPSSIDFYAVNGQYQPTLTIEAGRAHLLRFIHGAGYGIIQLSLVNATDCEMRLLARDGVFHTTPYLQLDTIVMMQGSRSDVAIRCSSSGVRTIQIRPNSAYNTLLSTGNQYTQDNLFTIDVQPRQQAATSIPTSQATFPAYLTALTTAIVSPPKQGVSSIVLTAGNGQFSINQVPFPGWDANQYVEQLCVNEVYQFNVPAPGGRPTKKRQPQAAPPHPYHQHVNHAQVMNNPDVTGAVVRQYEWRDVIPSLGVTFRFNTTEFAGKVVLHCHILQHEDNGMMGLFLVSSCATNTTATAATTGPASSTTAATSTSSATASEDATDLTTEASALSHSWIIYPPYLFIAIVMYLGSQF